MTKKRPSSTTIDNIPDLLVKNKKQFESELSERIQIGEDLLNRKVNSLVELQELRQDYDFWNEFNAEFLKRAFNRVNNQFFNDYTFVPLPGIRMGSVWGTQPQPTIQQLITETLNKIWEQLNRLKKIHAKIPLLEVIEAITDSSSKSDGDLQTLAVSKLSNLFLKFHKVAQSLRHRHGDRETLIIRDEYDVQDLLHSLLLIHFNDIRSEDYSPSYAGANSRTDFVLKEEKIIVEVKMANDHLTDREIGNQLLIDIGRYRSHPDCKVLMVFVYDKGDHIRNKVGLINDLEQISSPGLNVKVYIYPR